MTSIITGDIHLTESARDRYRWELFPWLAKMADEYQADNVIILGDMTDKKDRHGSALVNRMADGIAQLSERATVVILKGNHDYTDPACPFFGFLDKLSNVIYAAVPTDAELMVGPYLANCLLLPSSDDPLGEWGDIIAKGFTSYSYIFVHETFKTALCENGTASPDGLPPRLFYDNGFKGWAIAGDIHVPQKLSLKNPSIPEYVGAPYRVDFGDNYEPRVMLITAEATKRDLYFPCPMKHLIEIDANGECPQDMDRIKPGDQVKVRVHLRRAELSIWPKLQKAIRELAARGKWELYGPELRRAEEDDVPVVPSSKVLQRVDPIQLIKRYGEKESLSKDFIDVGAEILRMVQ